MRKFLTLLTAAAVALVGGLTLAPAANAESDGKVFVCKYVGTPGVDEVLQDGQNPIEVSANAIPGYVKGAAPASLLNKVFTDKQGRSIVIAVSAGTGGGQDDEPSITDCPGELPQVLDVASAVVTVTPATCLSGAILVYGAIENAAFSGTASGTVGTGGTYRVVATANQGAEFAGGETRMVFEGTLAGPLTGDACEEPVVIVDQRDLVTITIDCVNYVTSTQAQTRTGGGAWVNVGAAVVMTRATTAAEIAARGLDCDAGTVVVIEEVVVRDTVTRTVSGAPARVVTAAPARVVTAQPSFTGQSVSQ